MRLAPLLLAHLDPSAWACGERAFEALRVPPFEQATFTVRFPYRL
jgi:hypothetical protein